MWAWEGQIRWLEKRLLGTALVPDIFDMISKTENMQVRIHCILIANQNQAGDTNV